MQTPIRLIIASVVGLALTGVVANAQLHLTGHTTGSFTDPLLPNTTVVNAVDGSAASFTTGVPHPPNTIPTSILFANNTFTNVSSGQDIQLGLFTIHNGSDNIGSDASNAIFHLGLVLTAPTAQTIALGPIDFGIDNTINTSGNPVPDIFQVTFSQPAPVWINGIEAFFHINFTPVSLSIPENTTLVKGDVTVTFSSVPEPSTYAMWGAALLVGLIGFRSFRGRRNLPALSATA
jgi:hypothetical protein